MALKQFLLRIFFFYYKNKQLGILKNTFNFLGNHALIIFIYTDKKGEKVFIVKSV